MGDPDYPGLRIAGEFLALRKYFDKLVESVRYTQDQEIVRLKAIVRRDLGRVEVDSLREKIGESEWIAMSLVPGFFMGAFIIALSSAFETAMLAVADYLKAKTRSPLKLSDLHERATHKKISLYIETVTGRTLSLNPGSVGQLEELNTIRNCFAHANGNLANCNPKVVKAIERMTQADSGATIVEGTLVINNAMAQMYMDHVIEAINSILIEINAAYVGQLSSPKK